MSSYSRNPRVSRANGQSSDKLWLYLWGETSRFLRVDKRVLSPNIVHRRFDCTCGRERSRRSERASVVEIRDRCLWFRTTDRLRGIPARASFTATAAFSLGAKLYRRSKRGRGCPSRKRRINLGSPAFEQHRASLEILVSIVPAWFISSLRQVRCLNLSKISLWLVGSFREFSFTSLIPLSISNINFNLIYCSKYIEWRCIWRLKFVLESPDIVVIAIVRFATAENNSSFVSFVSVPEMDAANLNIFVKKFPRREIEKDFKISIFL